MYVPLNSAVELKKIDELQHMKTTPTLKMKVEY